MALTKPLQHGFNLESGKASAAILLVAFAKLSLPPLEFCFGTSPTQAEKSRPDRKAFGSAMLATRTVAKRTDARDRVLYLAHRV